MLLARACSARAATTWPSSWARIDKNRIVASASAITMLGSRPWNQSGAVMNSAVNRNE
jgi:hypothetical protein